MKYRRQTLCDIGPLLSYLTNVDKNGVEVSDGDGHWVDTPKRYK